MFLDLRTLMIVIIATLLLLAVSPMVTVGTRFCDGSGKWTCSMLLQAIVFTRYAARNIWSDFASGNF